ncbi:MAG: GrpB family protein [Muribaculaceae bacterium]|nr:GrpB family protein [Muribaculaceae bacterium]
MSKSLKDMTLEELWELFPIVLSPHNPHWTEWAKEEIATLSAILSGFDIKIRHIGSTAIPDIMAKPIVDILVEIPPTTDKEAIRKIMEAAGYICMSASDERMSFNKGYTPEGYAERVFHIHFHHTGDNDEIYFRDYLISNPYVAKEYESIKLSLLPKFKHNRDAYTEAKTAFVKHICALAKSSQ